MWPPSSAPARAMFRPTVETDPVDGRRRALAVLSQPSGAITLRCEGAHRIDGSLYEIGRISFVRAWQELRRNPTEGWGPNLVRPELRGEVEGEVQGRPDGDNYLVDEWEIGTEFSEDVTLARAWAAAAPVDNFVIDYQSDDYGVYVMHPRSVTIRKRHTFWQIKVEWVQV